MPRTRRITVQPPVGGINRSLAYQSQPPYTTPDARNVRPFDVFAERGRIGSRPGLTNAYELQIGASTNRIPRMLEALRTANPVNSTTFEDSFPNTYNTLASNDANWDAPTTLPPDSNVNDIGSVLTSIGQGGIAYTNTALSTNETPDGGGAYLVVSKTGGAGIGTGTYTIRGEAHNFSTFLGEPGTQSPEVWFHFFMDNTTPDPQTAGFSVKFFKSSHTVWRIDLYVDGTATANATTTMAPTDNVLRVVINNLNTASTTFEVNCYWGSDKSSADLSHTETGYTRTTQDRFGFHLIESNPSISTSQFVNLNYFRYEFRSDVLVLPYAAVASANGKIYHEKQQGVLQEDVTTAMQLGTDSHIMATQRLGTLYIADNDDSINLAKATDGAIDATGLLLTSASYANWATILSETTTDNNHVGNYEVWIYVTGSSSKAILGVYNISSIDTTSTENDTLTLASVSTTGPATDTDVSFRIIRKPKKFTATGGLQAWTATAGAGTVPPACRIITRWNDRIWLAGDPENPHVWYASRQGDPDDWNFGATYNDSQRAIAGVSSFLGTETTTDTGFIGDPITALMPFSDERLLVCTENSIVQLTGDPAQGGRADTKRFNVGVVGRTAWTSTGDGTIIFLSRDGIYEISPNGEPAPLSLALPKAFEGYLEEDYRVSLIYDVRFLVLHIWLTPKVAANAVHWLFDMRTRTFWSDSVDANHDPFAVLYFSSFNAPIAGAFFGCRDGYIRRFSETASDDDGTSFTWYSWIGPIRMGFGPDMDGLLMGMDGTLSSDSGDVTWETYVGNSAEAAYASTAVDTGTWSAGRNITVRPRVRGHDLFIRLTGTSAWSLEFIVLELQEAGRNRG